MNKRLVTKGLGGLAALTLVGTAFIGSVGTTQARDTGWNPTKTVVKARDTGWNPTGHIVVRAGIEHRGIER